MSISYHLEVEVENLPGDRHEGVIAAVAAEWDFNTDYPDPDEETLRITGYDELSASAAGPEHFARDVARAVWAANGGYCPVRVYATFEREDPDYEFEYSEEDFARLTAAEAPDPEDGRAAGSTSPA
jgi:hypothetical protein